MRNEGISYKRLPRGDFAWVVLMVLLSAGGEDGFDEFFGHARRRRTVQVHHRGFGSANRQLIRSQIVATIPAHQQVESYLQPLGKWQFAVEVAVQHIS